MLSLQTIRPDTLELLKIIASESIFSETRLVGGTSLALQYGHRQSIDLDFFGTIEDDAPAIRQCLSNFGNVQILKESKNIKIYFINEVKVDIVNYCYPWIDKAIIEDNIRLASPPDIAAMKVNAIVGRGSKKDFIDLYFLLQHYTLDQILSFYKTKYPDHNEFQALMSLSYFKDANLQGMPKMFKDADWEEIKEFVANEVRKIK